MFISFPLFVAPQDFNSNHRSLWVVKKLELEPVELPGAAKKGLGGISQLMLRLGSSIGGLQYLLGICKMKTGHIIIRSNEESPV